MFSSSNFVKAVGLATMLLFIGYIAQIIYNQTNVKIFSWYAPPELKDLNGNKITEVTPGQPVTITYHFERYASRCWGTNIQVLDGPVRVQFDETRSTIFVDKTTRMSGTLFYHIPKDLPAGRYHWRHIVYPTCGGEQSAPYAMDTGFVVTIK